MKDLSTTLNEQLNDKPKKSGKTYYLGLISSQLGDRYTVLGVLTKQEVKDNSRSILTPFTNKKEYIDEIVQLTKDGHRMSYIPDTEDIKEIVKNRISNN